MTDDLRRRVLDATYDEVAATGLSSLTVEAVAVRAGSSRATIYRHFPGGRDELIDSAVRREVDRFVASVIEAVPDVVGLTERIAGVMTGARHALRTHPLLFRLLDAEADALLPSLTSVQPLVHEAFVTVVRDALERGVTHDLPADVDEVADHAARMMLSYIGASGAWDLDDPGVLADVVRTRVLPSVLSGS